MKNKKSNAVDVSTHAEEGRAEARPYNVRPNTTIDAKVVWKQLEDRVVPGLRLSVVDRVVYANLLRHSRLEGKRQLRFSILWLAHNVRLTGGPVREAVRRLADQGALRLLERSKAGHVAEVKLPGEIRGAWRESRQRSEFVRVPQVVSMEDADFLQSLALRKSIHERERGNCFYCLRRMPERMQCLDHVVPRAKKGRNSYWNLVSCCVECNAKKGEKPAEDFLRLLFREGQLTTGDLQGRLRALEALAAGKLQPEVSQASDLRPLKRRWGR